jgi:hypothetical protein
METIIRSSLPINATGARSLPLGFSVPSHATRSMPYASLAEAHNMLTEVYAWFTEGFETKDLQEAKALLST